MVEKGATIDLVLGQGESSELVPVPKLKGMNSKQVASKLSSTAINTLFVRFADCATKSDSDKALVYKQAPNSGENAFINLGNSIKLWLSCDTIIKPVVMDSTATSNPEIGT